MKIGLRFEGGIAVVILAIVLDRNNITQGIQSAKTKRKIIETYEYQDKNYSSNLLFIYIFFQPHAECESDILDKKISYCLRQLGGRYCVMTHLAKAILQGRI